ncbi:MAG: DUF2116 family Zn-ribbon domain-containing protein [Methanobacteriota archaeon]|nr:MAG: DUF2116 family Zn-ribbon domain-containing protein [Euryarchaeota archaeon]
MKVHGENLVERIGQHRHCRNCERAIPFKQEYCGEDCETEWKGKMNTKKRQLTFFYILMVIIMIFAISLTFMG